MGVYIFLDMIPNHIKEADWQKVYEESLQLIEAYPFMDEIRDDSTYDHPWRYVDRAKERELSTDEKPMVGWHIDGDLQSMQSAEPFRLIRDFKYHSKNKRCDTYGDVLAKQIFVHVDDNIKEYESRNFANIRVFDGKTQGYPYHLYVLAIACLIECRFPHYALVYGDISIGQMKKAIEWANTILEKPIHLPERVDNQKLLKRIRRILDNELDILQAFMNLTLHDKDVKLGEFIRRSFRKDVINTYYMKMFNTFRPKQFGFRDRLMEFINLGFPIQDAATICVLDPFGPSYDEDHFINVMLSLDWPTTKRIGEKSSLFKTADSEEPDTVSSQFGKIALKMAGVQGFFQTDLTYQEVIQRLEEIFQRTIPMKDVELERQKEEDAFNVFLEEFSFSGDGSLERKEVIEKLRDLIFWKPGDTIHPSLEEALNRLKNFIKNSIEVEREALFTNFASTSEREKMNDLIKNHDYYPIRKSAWNEIKQSLHDPQLAKINLAVLLIKADEKGTNQLCKALMNNQDLLREYIVWE